MRQTKTRPSNRKPPTRLIKRPNSVGDPRGDQPKTIQKMTPKKIVAYARTMQIHPAILAIHPELAERGVAAEVFASVEMNVRNVLSEGNISTAEELKKRSVQSLVKGFLSRDTSRVSLETLQDTMEILDLVVQNVAYYENLP
jgi:hypothetical protein